MLSVRKIAKRVLPQRTVDWLWRRLSPATVKTPPTHTLRAALVDLGPGADKVIELENKLWATGDPKYADQLDRTVRKAIPGSRARARGSVALARWDLYRGRPEPALQRVETVRSYDADLQSEADLLRVDTLFELGDARTALTTLSTMTGRSTNEQNLFLRVGQARSLLTSNANHGSGPVVESLNRIYSTAGLGLIRRANVAQPVGVDNLACDVDAVDPHLALALPLVSVVVVVPDSLPERRSDLSSLLAQSWSNVEVVLVGRSDVRRHLSEADQVLLDHERLVFVEADEDAGHPVAQGASQASGELITSHRYGSWAHPQRVEAQATALLLDSEKRGCVSFHMRVKSDLEPCPLAAVPGKDLVGPDPWSVMISTAGLSPDQVMSEYDRVVERFSPVTGMPNLPRDVVLVEERSPMTLNLGEIRSPILALQRLPQ